MHRAVRLWAAVSVLCLGARTAATAPPPVDIADIVEKLLPTVVNISTEALADPNAPGRPKERELLGSGFIVDASGLILTNAHVIAGAYEINVVLQDQTELHATLLAGNKAADIAVLKVTAGRPLPVAKFGDSNRVRVGQPIFVIGNPGGLGGSVTAGIVSAVNRNISVSSYDDYIQTDAAINHGNSGGPMFNLAGEVIGMNATIFSPTATSGSIGLGFAIPANDVAFVSDSLIRYGKLRIGYFGIGLQQLTTDVAAGFGLPDVAGAIVTYVVPASAAETAGVEVGDVLLAIGGKPLSDSRAAMRAIAELAPGASAEVSVWRERHAMPLTIVASDQPAAQQSSNDSLVVPPPKVRVDAPHLGMKLAELTDYVRGQNNLRPDQQGVLVADVAPFNVAEDRGIKAGEVLVRAADKLLETVADVTSYLDRLRAEKAPLATFLVQGTGGRRWVGMPLAR